MSKYCSAGKIKCDGVSETQVDTCDATGAPIPISKMSCCPFEALQKPLGVDMREPTESEQSAMPDNVLPMKTNRAMTAAEKEAEMLSQLNTYALETIDTAAVDKNGTAFYCSKHGAVEVFSFANSRVAGNFCSVCYLNLVSNFLPSLSRAKIVSVEQAKKMGLLDDDGKAVKLNNAQKDVTDSKNSPSESKNKSGGENGKREKK